MEWGELLGLVVCIIIPLAVGYFGLLFGPGGRQTDEWYKELRKPSWTPPNWAFPVVWTILYILMGISSWLVWKDGGFEKHAAPLVLYIVQLVLNGLWTPFFFGMGRIGLALVDIIALWVFILATIVVFSSVSHVAAYLLIPYILWVTVATCLNLTIWIYNRSSPSAEERLII